MRFMTQITNELPFMLELPNGIYNINTSIGMLEIDINSNLYYLHTARFTEFSEKHCYIGEKDELQNIITNNGISNYAFADCKTFITFRRYSEKNFSEVEYSCLTEKECIGKIKSNLLSNGIKYTDVDDLEAKSSKCYFDASPEDIESLKQDILIENEFSQHKQVFVYYEALNKLVRQYSYLRKHFWVHKIDENILEGTLIQDFLDGKLYSSITFVGSAPSILPKKKKYPEISDEEKTILKERLALDFTIPIEDELILVARSLWYRLEYRSAIIESSAALEIAVEKKLVEKMTLQEKSIEFIEVELKKTETNFNQRCDSFLKKYAGKSFVIDQAALWLTIDEHRKNFRHRIAHSDIKPNKNTTKTIINDFEKAIQYISSL